MKFIETFKKTSREEIRKMEDSLGIKLPSEYIDYLLAFNGGRPEKPVFKYYQKIGGLGELAMIQYFLGVNTGEYEDISNYLKIYRGRIPENLIPIADDPGGNLICLSTSGSVYFWHHELEKEKPDYENVYLISSDFQDFLNNLKSHEDI